MGGRKKFEVTKPDYQGFVFAEQSTLDSIIEELRKRIDGAREQKLRSGTFNVDDVKDFMEGVDELVRSASGGQLFSQAGTVYTEVLIFIAQAVKMPGFPESEVFLSELKNVVKAQAKKTAILVNNMLGAPGQDPLFAPVLTKAISEPMIAALNKAIEGRTPALQLETPDTPLPEEEKKELSLAVLFDQKHSRAVRELIERTGAVDKIADQSLSEQIKTKMEAFRGIANSEIAEIMLAPGSKRDRSDQVRDFVKDRRVAEKSRTQLHAVHTHLRSKLFRYPTFQELKAELRRRENPLGRRESDSWLSKLCRRDGLAFVSSRGLEAAKKKHWRLVTKRRSSAQGGLPSPGEFRQSIKKLRSCGFLLNASDADFVKICKASQLRLG